jgi:hypothetical protein
MFNEKVEDEADKKAPKTAFASLSKSKRNVKVVNGIGNKVADSSKPEVLNKTIN